MSDSNISAEDLRDAFRRLRWWELTIPVLSVVALRVSRHALIVGGPSLGLRVAWMLLPVPFFVLVFWGIIRNEQRKSELERQISRVAAQRTLLFTVALLLLLGQVDTAFALGGSAFEYRDLWILPVLAHMLFSVSELRRYTRT